MEQYMNSFDQKGEKLTYMAFICEVVARIINEFPSINSSIDGDTAQVNRYVNIGIAVDTEQGLLVPVIKNAENLRLADFANAINDLSDRAHSNKLTPDDLNGETFSIFNFGDHGITIGFPSISHSPIAILSVGAVQKRAVVINDAIAIRPMMNISLTYDHRFVNVEAGSKFLHRVSQLLAEFDVNTVI